MPAVVLKQSDTHGGGDRKFSRCVQPNVLNRRKTEMANKVIRIRLKAYDHQLIDQSAERIVETAKRTDAKVSGPSPSPPGKRS